MKWIFATVRSPRGTLDRAPVASSHHRSLDRGTRLHYLDGLRATAALFVLIHHAFSMAYPIHLGIAPTGITDILTTPAVYGYLGVPVFIVLAGYSLSLGFYRRKPQRGPEFRYFITRRTKRIIPPYWAALVCTIVLASTLIKEPTGTHWDQSVPTDPESWVINAFLLQDFVPVKDTAYTFWSISVEYHIYLLIPALLLLRIRLSWVKSILILIVLAVGFTAWGGSSEYISHLHPEFYLLFVLAVATALFAKTNSAWATRTPWSACAVLLLATIIVLDKVKPRTPIIDLYTAISIIAGLATLAILLSIETGRARILKRMLEWQPLVSIGLFSYSLYLIHAPLLQVIWQYGINPISRSREVQLLILWCGAVPITVALAFLFYLLFEKRFLPENQRGRVPRKSPNGAVRRIKRNE